jgi:hypothetical protein
MNVLIIAYGYNDVETPCMIMESEETAHAMLSEMFGPPISWPILSGDIRKLYKASDANKRFADMSDCYYFDEEFPIPSDFGFNGNEPITCEDELNSHNLVGSFFTDVGESELSNVFAFGVISVNFGQPLVRLIDAF